MKSEEIVEAALQAARDRKVKIVRGPVFIWGREKMPEACNAIGALLLRFELQEMARDGFQKGWIERLCEASGLTWPWLWRFNHGWDRGNCLTVTYMENGKEHTSHDETSRSANKMALKWTL